MLTIFSDATFQNIRRVNLGVYIILEDVTDEVTNKILKKEYEGHLKFTKLHDGLYGELETIYSCLAYLKSLFDCGVIPVQSSVLYTDDNLILSLIKKDLPKNNLEYYVLTLIKVLNVEVRWIKGHCKKRLMLTNEQKIFCHIDRATRRYSKLLTKGHIFIPGISD